MGWDGTGGIEGWRSVIKGGQTVHIYGKGYSGNGNHGNHIHMQPKTSGCVCSRVRSPSPPVFLGLLYYLN